MLVCDRLAAAAGEAWQQHQKQHDSVLARREVHHIMLLVHEGSCSETRQAGLFV